MKMGFFNFGRQEGFPSMYAPNKTSVTIDYTETIFVLLFIIIAIASIAIIFGFSKKRSICVAVKVLFSIAIGCLLIVENFGQEWESGAVKTVAHYRAGEKHEIESTIGIKIGLRSVNITLRGKGEKETPLEKEIINYNERFPWTWDQGILGFGPYAGVLQRTLREFQRKGLPIPILSVAEYFIIDGEGIRFGRFYRTAGWYCHILLWTAFATWILTNIFLQSVGRYAAYFTALTGLLQLSTCIIWMCVRNPQPLIIPFTDGILKVRPGLHFWMTLTCGLVCISLAMILIFMDLRHPNALSIFLGIDPLNQYDECLLRASELNSITWNRKKSDKMMEMTTMSDSVPLITERNNGMMIMKRRSTMQNAQKALFRAPLPVQIEDYEDVAVYENQSFDQSSTTAGPSSEKSIKPKAPVPIPKRVKRVKNP